MIWRSGRDKWLGVTTPQESLRRRTKAFALGVVHLVSGGSSGEADRVIGRQLLRSSTSVAANYRSAGRARSRREFTSRIGVVLEEVDESLFWLELLEELRYRPGMTVPLRKEAHELVSIFSASYETSRRQPRRPLPDPQIPRSPD